jgi:hypothetical protein
MRSGISPVKQASNRFLVKNSYKGIARYAGKLLHHIDVLVVLAGSENSFNLSNLATEGGISINNGWGKNASRWVRVDAVPDSDTVFF